MVPAKKPAEPLRHAFCKAIATTAPVQIAQSLCNFATMMRLTLGAQDVAREFYCSGSGNTCQTSCSSQLQTSPNWTKPSSTPCRLPQALCEQVFPLSGKVNH